MNEISNGLLREDFPRGTVLRTHEEEELATLARPPTARPRMTLDRSTVAERPHRLLSPTLSAGVARTE